MLKFLIKLGQEYLITESITGKPGPIIKGPGYRILNPFTKRPKVRNEMPGAFAADYFDNAMQRGKIYTQYELFPFKNIWTEGEITLVDSHGNTKIVDINYEFGFPQSQDLYRFYWQYNHPYSQITRTIKSKVQNAFKRTNRASVDKFQAQHIPDIIEDLTQAADGLYARMGVFVDYIRITSPNRTCF